MVQVNSLKCFPATAKTALLLIDSPGCKVRLTLSTEATGSVQAHYYIHFNHYMLPLAKHIFVIISCQVGLPLATKSTDLALLVDELNESSKLPATNGKTEICFVAVQA